MVKPPTPDDVVLLAMMTRGDLVVPANERSYKYEITKLHNVSLHDKVKPLMFLLCKDEGDVVQGLQFCLKHDLPLSVRSGAHGVDGASCRDGSFVLDLSGLNTVQYDAQAETVTFGSGATLGDLNVSLLREGRHLPVGVAPPTGCGLILHGGIGYSTFKYGASVENIVGARVLLADGETIKDLTLQSQGEDKELFFAVRGAASTVGIVLEITCRTYPMENVTGGMWLMEDDDQYSGTTTLTDKAFRIVQEQEEKGQRTLSGMLYMTTVPPDPSIPAKKHGKPATMAIICNFGADDAALDLASQFSDRPILFGKAPSVMPMNVFNQILSGMMLVFPPHLPYWKAALLRSVPDRNTREEFRKMWVAERKPYMEPNLVGYEFTGGKGGRENAARLNGPGNEPCACNVSNYLVAVPAMLYCPPGDDGMFEEMKGLSRRLISLFDEQDQSDYVNLHMDDEDDNSTEIAKKTYNNNLGRVKAVKAKVDPNNIFYRNLIKTEHDDDIGQ